MPAQIVMLTRLLALYCLGMAALVGVYFVLSPVVNPGATEFPIWEVLNYFMAVAIFISLVASFVHKLEHERGGGPSDTVEYIRLTGAFYGAVLLTLWFFWRWFIQLQGDDGSELSWTLIDPAFAIVVGAIGRHIWQNADRG